jgi:hypothetical protein
VLGAKRHEIETKEDNTAVLGRSQAKALIDAPDHPQIKLHGAEIRNSLRKLEEVVLLRLS